jgi:predicted transcriptional regulator
MKVRFTPDEEARFRAAIRRGIEQADQGQFIEEDEMDARVERMFPSSMETPYFP